jgi:DNA-binding NarL/FixJ family response regulator
MELELPASRNIGAGEALDSLEGSALPRDAFLATGNPRTVLEAAAASIRRGHRGVLALVLESRGYTPSVAHTGSAGLALFQEQHPSIVLCDIGLPEMDGIEVCKRVRELELDYTVTYNLALTTLEEMAKE